jgi:hypothetical protein
VNHWWRAYNEAVNDPKLQLISDALFRAWFNLMCIASGNDGALPAIGILAFTLRMKPEKVGQVLTQLHGAGLLDKTETGFIPHNWSGRQYKSDKTDETAAERMARYRERKRNERNASVTDTAPREQTTEQKDSEACASGAEAPIDHRKRLFNEGLKTLGRLTGKGPDACRSFVGKCLKASSDDAIIVLGLIEDADRNQVVDPSAWIAARLKTPETGNGKPKSAITQAIKNLNRNLASFDGPPREVDELCGAEGGTPPRLLSHG